ncbi:MAG: YoaK family protein [Chitinophagaceae bacterium]
MFRHTGKSRTYLHNLKLASILSFVAGIVNATGLLALKVLTTNVTGHFAYFSEEVSGKNYRTALIFLFFIFSFLSGAFVSNFFVELVSRNRPGLSYSIPLLMETAILISMGIAGYSISSQLAAGMLLFAMGLQNALVTKISRSVVRTTHLTGLFTDLGIELSQLLFYRRETMYRELKKNISLKIAIIACFFLGCLTGGIAFRPLGLKTLLPAAGFLLLAFFYDNIRFLYYHARRRIIDR